MTRSRSYDRDAVNEADAKVRAQRESTEDQRASTAGPARPDSRPEDGAPRGSVDHASAIGGLPVVNVSGDPRAMPQGNVRRRGPDGRLLRAGFGGRSAITGEWLNERRCDVLHNPWPGDFPEPKDLSSGPAPAEKFAALGRPHVHDPRAGYCYRRDCYGPYPQDFRNEVASNAE